MQQYANICVDVWGDFARFTRNSSKVERVTYYVPTPSACRGILNAILCKPLKFYYEITSIEVMNPIKTINIMQNGVRDKISVKSAKNNKGYSYLSGGNLSRAFPQQQTLYLKDVYYRIHARIVLRDDAPDDANIFSLRDQFYRMVTGGKCLMSPYLGARECMCYFGPKDLSRRPIDDDADLGIMLYDMFDITDNKQLTTDKSMYESNKDRYTMDVHRSYFHAVMNHGCIQVPYWGSDEILMDDTIYVGK